MPAADESNPIEAVRARLDGGRKWLQGQTVGPAGSSCIGGAGLTDGVPEAIDAVIVEQYPDRLFGVTRTSEHISRIVDFNDHPDTTWADVDLVLDKAARRWDEAAR